MICLMICLVSTSFMASEIKRMLLFAKTRKKEKEKKKEKDNYLHWEEGSYFVFKQIILTITFD